MTTHALPKHAEVPRLLLAPPMSNASSAGRVDPAGRAWWRIVLWLSALIAAVIAFSVLLVPRGVERLLLQHVAGRPLDRATEVLEARYASGDRSGVLLEALARARIEHGDVPGGLALLQTILSGRPDDLELLGLLARGYRISRRENELLEVLERLQGLRPDAARQRELVALIQRVGTPEQHRRAQQELVERFDAGEVADYLIVAQRHRAQGDAKAALATLGHMLARFPAALDVSVAVLQVSLLLQVGDAAGALERGRRWLRDHPDSPEHVTLAIASAFGGSGRPELVASFLEPYCSEASAPTAFLKVWAQAVSDAGHPALALGRLDAAGDRVELRLLRLRLALASGRVDQALKIAHRVGLEWVPDDSLLALAGVALAPQGAEMLREMGPLVMRRVGAIDPLLAGQIAWKGGDRVAATSWARRAEGNGVRGGLRAVQLARLFEQVGDADRARASLRRASPEDGTAFPLAEWARLNLQLGLASESLPTARRLLTLRADTVAQESWALLATAAGRQAEVVDWILSAQGDQSSAFFYRDLLHVAFDFQAERAAAAAAERLRARVTEADDRLLIARALSGSGRPGEALEQFRALRRQGRMDAQTWQGHLLSAWRRGADVGAELRQETVELLRGTSDVAVRDASLEVLMELGAWADVLPVLEGLALSAPQRWLGVFTQAAERGGARAILARVWTRLGTDESVPPRLRSQVAFRLLESGDKPGAERIFRQLAAQAEPEDPVTRQLLFLWGPRPGHAAMDWIETRAAEASGTARARWLEILDERGGAARVLRLIQSVPVARRDPAIVTLQLRALQHTGSRAALRTALVELADAGQPPQVVALMLRSVGQVGDPALEQRVMEQAAALGSEDPQVWRSVGESRLARRELQSAQEAFATALRVLDSRGEATPSARSLRAGLLYRLGRVAEARASYEALLDERPNDDALRADYVSMLLALDQTGTAQAALSRRSR